MRPSSRPERAAADPDDLAGRAELVEQARACSRRRGRAGRRARGPTPGSARPRAGRRPRSAGRGRPAADPTPCQAGQEAGEDVRLDRLDLAAQAGQRSAPQLAQDVGIGELVRRAARPEGALQQRARRPRAPRSRSSTVARADAPARGRRLGRERRVAARPAQRAARRAARRSASSHVSATPGGGLAPTASR